MKKDHLLYGVIICLVILVIYLLSSDYELFGLYSADDYYLQDASLKKMTLFIGDIDKEKSTATKTAYGAYLYIATDKVIEDQKIIMYMRRIMSMDGCHWYSLSVTGSNSWDDIPLKMRLCPNKHLITILSGDTVYAELYKDNALTDYAKNVD